MKLIDKLLDNITMYRLVLYYLIFLIISACLLSYAGIISYGVLSLLFTTAFLVVICSIVNNVFAKVFEVVVNMESVYISALILALIITPVSTFTGLVFIGWASIWTMASKYIFAISRKHLFNPVAFAVALTALTINQPATWWVGTSAMMPAVMIGGLLLIRKLRRVDLVLSFFLSALLTISVFTLNAGGDLLSALQRTILYSALLFLGFVMLTEPLTTPPNKKLQIIYGAVVGFLFAPQIHLGSFYFSPELALLVGNIFSYLVSPKRKLVLKLKEKIKIAPEIFDFIFEPVKEIDNKLVFLPGQYLEWTLEHNSPDSRGNRRYFTIASAPTERGIRMGIKFSSRTSSFKKSLMEMDENSQIVASQLAGDFTLPKNPLQKVVLVAGGIGITPFRSMIKYLLDTGERRPVTLIYSNKTADEIVYREVFERACQELGIRVVYTLTDLDNIPAGWTGRSGRIDRKMIEEEVPGYQDSIFYLSGPHQMVTSFAQALSGLGIPGKKIITDYFPGFA